MQHSKMRSASACLLVLFLSIGPTIGGGDGDGIESGDATEQRLRRMGLSSTDAATVADYMTRLGRLAERRHGALGAKDSGSQNNKAVEQEELLRRKDAPAQDDALTRWRASRRKDERPRLLKEQEQEVDGNPEERGPFFEGDIVLFPDQAQAIYEHQLEAGKGRVKRKFIGSPLRRWNASRPIMYSFDGSHTQREQRIIELALEHWHNITCLNFERRDDNPTGNRLVFTDVDGCASNVGRHPLGEEQLVSLAPECIRLGVIAHEVAHALGFWHEQSRPDRDQYVQVRWENIDKDSKGQFLKEEPDDVDTAGVPYDYGSIMHYRSKAFSRYDDLYTINTFVADYQKTIGQRDQLSFNDIRLMNKIYCSFTCPIVLPCQRGGYTDPRRCDRCRCPDGFTGKYCEQVMPGYGAVCGGRVALSRGWTRLHSPGYPSEFREGQECSWLLQAPPGHIVQFQFVGEFEMYCKVRHSLCMDYVEIRNSTDFANTGMRYCCYGRPSTVIHSATTDMLVLFRSFYRGGKGFSAQARALAYAGHWSGWSGWSSCTATCGACGSRMRTRICPPGGACLGEPTEVEVCALEPCSGLCTRRRPAAGEEECAGGGFLALLRGIRCTKREPATVVEPCDNACCPGFEVRAGLCARH